MDNNLKPRQDSFCVHYTTIGGETYSHGTKAALAAGYSESSAHVTATKLLKQEAIKNRIIELQAELIISYPHNMGNENIFEVGRVRMDPSRRIRPIYGLLGALNGRWGNLK